MRKNKKAQEGIIVTVLLILIAILAIAVVAVFVMKNVKNATLTAEDKSNCMKVNFEVKSATIIANNLAQIVVTRTDASDVSLKGFKVFKNDKFLEDIIDPAQMPGALETSTLTTVNTTAIGDIIRLNAILTSGHLCEGGQQSPTPVSKTANEIACDKVQYTMTAERGNGYINVAVITFTRIDSSGVVLKGVKVYRNGAFFENITTSVLNGPGTDDIETTQLVSPGDMIKISPIINSGYSCESLSQQDSVG